MTVTLHVEKLNGDVLGPEDVVFLERNGIHSLFSSCDVRMNDEIVSSMTAYPYTSTLSRYLGCSMGIRESVWTDLDGSWVNLLGKSDLVGVDESQFMSQIAKIAKSRSITLYGRVYSDVLTSCRQYLPPGVSLGIDLRRSPDAFALNSVKTVDGYRINIETASLYLQRLRLKPSLLPSVLSSITSQASLVFNRFETKMMAIPKGAKVWRWLDFLFSAPLPNRVYFSFVAQDSLYGNINKSSTHFEPLNMTSLNVKLNGRDLMVQPLMTSFTLDSDQNVSLEESDGLQGYFTILEVLNLVSDQTSTVRLQYETYMKGMTIYALELGKCGEKSGENGCIDLEVTFGKGGSYLDACCVIFTERTETLAIPLRK